MTRRLELNKYYYLNLLSVPMSPDVPYSTASMYIFVNIFPYDTRRRAIWLSHMRLYENGTVLAYFTRSNVRPFY